MIKKNHSIYIITENIWELFPESSVKTVYKFLVEVAGVSSNKVLT